MEPVQVKIKTLPRRVPNYIPNKPEVFQDKDKTLPEIAKYDEQPGAVLVTADPAIIVEADTGESPCQEMKKDNLGPFFCQPGLGELSNHVKIEVSDW